MRTNEELNVLAQRKAVLLARIAERRDQCVAAMGELTPHLEMVEGAMSKWRMLAAGAKALGVTGALTVAKTMAENEGGLGGILRFGASLFGGARKRAEGD
jgi:hypothetical protein